MSPRPGTRHPRCGGRWRGPFPTDAGALLACNTCGEAMQTNAPVPPTALHEIALQVAAVIPLPPGEVRNVEEDARWLLFNPSFQLIAAAAVAVGRRQAAELLHILPGSEVWKLITGEEPNHETS